MGFIPIVNFTFTCKVGGQRGFNCVNLGLAKDAISQFLYLILVV